MNRMFLVGGVVIIAGLLVLWYIFTKDSKELSDVSMDKYTGGIYTDYDQTTLSSLSGDIVLFFHADWCPTCIAAEKNFLASGIPDGLTILKVDFDTATELRKKYTVLSQTSFVLIHPDGTMIKRWVGGRTIQDIIEKIDEAKKVDSLNIPVKQSSGKSSTAYFAGGCFRCMEGPFESLDGVTEVINGYIGGDERNANYNKVSLGVTKHREAVKVIYDPDIVSYAELLATYRRQIDPTDAGGQFADRGSQYRTAIYYSTSGEKEQIVNSQKKIEASGKFSKPIVVEILSVTPFYPAEEYHQDYYKKKSADYKSYKKGSGREDFIYSTWTGDITKTNTKILSRKDKKPKIAEDLTAEQRRILFEGGTEPPFNNAYRDNHEAGIYVDVIDGTPLFSSTDKFDSDTGWPAFTKPINESLVYEDKNTYHPIYGTEVETSGSRHLGHVFDDGLADHGGQRYCINSATLEFIPLADLDAKGYSEYKKLFSI